MDNNKHDIIIFLGRPGAGKSEVIDFLQKTPVEERRQKFGVGDFTVVDDFEYLWEKGQEDDMLAELGRERLYTKTDTTGYGIKDPFLYDFLLKKVSHRAVEDYIEKDYLAEQTLFIEFSRGGEGAYQHAISLLGDAILSRAVILYVQVSYQEACRKNIRRYNAEAKGSILEHTLPEYIMERYQQDDFDRIEKEDTFRVGDYEIPLRILRNEPEITDDNEALGKALTEALGSK